MKVTWLGHASFLIELSQGTRIITDPYTPGDGLDYATIEEASNVVTVSHEHADHNNTRKLKGNPIVLKGAGSHEAAGIIFKGIATYHDEAQGRQRGQNTVFCWDAEGIRLCHLGDLGHALSKAQVESMGAVDVLLVPVGGFYTIDAAVATQVCQALRPRVAIPMHFKTEKCAYPIAKVDNFTRGKQQIKEVAGSTIEIKAGKLPPPTEIVVLKPAL